MPRQEKFFEKSLRALSSRNWTWDGVELGGEEEEDAPEWRRFRDKVDLRLGAIEQAHTRKRERKKRTEKHEQDQYHKIENWRYVCMRNAWTCDM